MADLLKCWKVCEPIEKLRSEERETHSRLYDLGWWMRTCITSVSALVFGIWDLFHKREVTADEMRSFARSCVVLQREIRSLNDVRGECEEDLLSDLWTGELRFRTTIISTQHTRQLMLCSTSSRLKVTLYRLLSST